MPTSTDPSGNWNALRDALGQALDLGDADRQAYLDGLDPDLLRALRPLLDAALADDPVLDHPDVVLAPLAAADPTVAEGAVVGPYRIVALVGEGGMGRVYRARRADGAFDRTVAVKVVRQSLALAGADVAARLRRERDLLAALDHPGIARLLDGGETEDGVSYLVTEFVDGPPITEWAEAQDLDVRDRVRLLLDVARAVDHAHRRLVVHRDLKPSNVLVTEADGTPRPVVLDFGIAKLLDEPNDASNAFPLTRTGIRLLTPAYAAPELFEPGVSVTTAADVYGLGALLYELLTGRRPHDDVDGPPTTEPALPSRAVATADGEAPFDPAVRSRALRGDLDTICLKALHPDPARRYASAAALADDLERSLDGRPVEARPDSVAYLVGRFARRNRTAVVASVAVLTALVAGLVVSLSALQAERAARAEADEAADRAIEAADFLTNVLRTADPAATDGEPMTTRQSLDLSIGMLADVDSPILKGTLLTSLGAIYGYIGEFHLADSLLVESVRALTAAAPDGLDVHKAQLALGYVRWAAGDYEDAKRQLRLAYEGGKRFDAHLAVEAAYALAGFVGGEEAVVWAQRGLRDLRRLGTNPVEEAVFSGALARALLGSGRHEEAIEILRRALDELDGLGGEYGSQRAQLMADLSKALVAAGEWDEAETYALRSLAWRQTLVPSGSPRLYQHWIDVADMYATTERPQLAEAYYDSALTAAYALFPPNSVHRSASHLQRGQVRNRIGKFAGAEADALEALRIAEALTESGIVADATREIQIARRGHRVSR